LMYIIIASLMVSIRAAFFYLIRHVLSSTRCVD
jgi:hypothetical protein